MTLMYLLRGYAGEGDPRFAAGEPIKKLVYPGDVGSNVKRWHALGRTEVTATAVMR